MKLSIVIPVYNEKSTVEQLLDAVRAVDFGMDREVVMVDDGSTDGTRDVLPKLEDKHDDVRVFFQERNMGKGAALRRGFQEAGGDLVIVQDADMEYDPKEIPKLLAPVVSGHADVVFGSRFLGGGAHRVVYYWHYVGNRFLTTFSNMTTNLNLTDMEVCYKLFKAEIIKGVELEEDRFGFEPEVTAKVAANPKWRVYEVPISYYGRSYDEGKKIGWRDGCRAIYCIVKYGFKTNPLPLLIMGGIGLVAAWALALMAFVVLRVLFGG